MVNGPPPEKWGVDDQTGAEVVVEEVGRREEQYIYPGGGCTADPAAAATETSSLGLY